MDFPGTEGWVSETFWSLVLGYVSCLNCSQDNERTEHAKTKYNYQFC